MHLNDQGTRMFFGKPYHWVERRSGMSIHLKGTDLTVTKGVDRLVLVAGPQPTTGGGTSLHEAIEAHRARKTGG